MFADKRTTRNPRVFGSAKESKTSGDLIKKIKADIVFKEQLLKNTYNQQKSYNDFLFNVGMVNNRRKRNCVIDFEKDDLQISLYTKVDLQCIPVVTQVCLGGDLGDNIDGYDPVNVKVCSNPSTISLSKQPFYSYYNIDPDNSLYQNKPCSSSRWQNYMKIYNPKDNIVQYSRVNIAQTTIERCLKSSYL